MIKVELQFNEKVVSYSIHYDRTINGEFKPKKNLISQFNQRLDGQRIIRWIKYLNVKKIIEIWNLD